MNILGELTTHLVRPVIKIDGVAYELLHPDELSLTQQHGLRQRAERIQRVYAGEDDPEALGLATRELEACIQLLMPTLPAEILAQLSDMQRLAIVQGFSGLASQTALASVPSGGNSSPESNGSTGDAPRIGS